MKWIELENEVTNLEQVEKLLTIYNDFLDDECPNEEELKQKDNMESVLKAVIYSKRTEIYKSVLSSAFNLIRQVKESLDTAVDKMIAEAKKAKEAKAIKQ